MSATRSQVQAARTELVHQIHQQFKVVAWEVLPRAVYHRLAADDGWCHPEPLRLPGGSTTTREAKQANRPDRWRPNSLRAHCLLRRYSSGSSCMGSASGWGRSDGSQTPIERKWFGENKTYRGVVCVALGTAVGFVVIDPRFLSLGGVHHATELALLGLNVGIAAMLAELPNSFLKRRMGIAPGAQTGGIRGVAFHVLDQIDVVFGAWAVLAWVARPTVGRLGGTLGTVYIGHQLVSLVGYLLGMRTSAR
jgi:CDP-archaeol synthase